MKTVFEALMLICFGAAWPASIYRSYKSRSTKGKSVLFLYIILIGYIFGMTNKIVNGIDYVLVFYIIDFVFVSIDLGLYYRNKRIESRH